MSKYYREEVIKDTPARQKVLDSVDKFLEKKRQEATKKRSDFFNFEDYIKNPNIYRNKFIDMLGFPLKESRGIKSVEEEFVAKDNNVDIFRLHFTFNNGLCLYGLYFKQIDNAKPSPFIIGLHGGWGTPELVSSIHFDSSNYNHLVRRLTDKGASVFVPQLLLWNVDCYGNKYDRVEIDCKLKELGGSITALEIYLIRGALDWFIENEHVNTDKIGVAGMSYGGMYALHLTACDERIKACYSSSWMCDVFEWLKPDWSYRNAQKTFTAVETACLISPRPLVVSMGNKDEYWKKGCVKACAEVSSFYKQMGFEENFRYVEFDGVHEVDNDDVEIDFLFNALS